jgi:hypothetical protein
VHYFDAWRLPGEDRAVRAVHWYDRPGGVLSTFPDFLGDLASIQDVTTRSALSVSEWLIEYRLTGTCFSATSDGLFAALAVIGM